MSFLGAGQGPALPRAAAGSAAGVAGEGVPHGLLRASQARILLAALLGVHGDPVAVRDALPGYTGG